MKNSLQNLLIFLSLCLCGLVAFQWRRETVLQMKLQELTNSVRDGKASVEGLNVTIQRDEDEVRRLDALKNSLIETGASNQLEIRRLRAQLDQANEGNRRNLGQIGVYEAALEKANGNIALQKESISNADVELKQLTLERNDAVAKYNQMVQQFNDLAKKWNDLQTMLAKTNAPGKVKRGTPAKE